MIRKLARVSSKGHVILPRKLREVLKINSGDYVEIGLEDGVIKIAPAESKAESLAGVLKSKVKGEVDFKTTREKVAEEVAKDAAEELD